MEQLRIKKLFKSNTPFAVMQYFEWFKTQRQNTCKKYELMYIDDKKLKFDILDDEGVSFLKSNLSSIKPIIDTKDGKIYEYNNFKKYKESLI